ncbi:ribonuclease Z [Bernardetia sp.]|uniref:ribonuclease Z n=1 Tax=Bernardetia sp. TaxID=1937974 RepID=UPI0025BAD39A|nr:ribonuclease Z [Bernardetia sp.]
MVFELTILGTNAAIPAYGRFPTSQVLCVNHRYYLIDCGEGTQIQLFRYKIKINKIHAIFISHLHGDHYLGLMGLLNTMNLRGRTEPLYLHAPKGLQEIITVQLKYSYSVLGYPIYFIETNQEESVLIFEDEKVTVHTIPLLHRIPCCGFLFREKAKDRNLMKEKIPTDLSIAGRIALKKGEDAIYQDKILKNEDYTYLPNKRRSYAFCSDTIYLPSLVETIKNVDLLYHEATFTHVHEKRAAQTFHSTGEQAAKIAQQADVKRLVLGHFSTRYHDLTPLLEEAKTVFPNSFLAIEGETFSVDE